MEAAVVRSDGVVLLSRRSNTVGIPKPLVFMLLLLAVTTNVTSSFYLTPTQQRPHCMRLYEASTSDLVLSVRDYLQENHSVFFNLVLSKNDQAWKTLSKASTLTIFAVTDQGMRENVGETKLHQLQDQRNEETVLRMAEYHTVAEDAVTAQALFDSGGIVTVSQDVIPVERTKTGGFLFLGGTEDGGVTVGGSNVVSTVTLANGKAVIHATDNVVSPSILWRYCGQLRIPGSK